MKVEGNPENCGSCVFKRGGVCSRTGSEIDRIKVCLGGPFYNSPPPGDVEQLERLLSLAGASIRQTLDLGDGTLTEQERQRLETIITPIEKK